MCIKLFPSIKMFFSKGPGEGFGSVKLCFQDPNLVPTPSLIETVNNINTRYNNKFLYHASIKIGLAH